MWTFTISDKKISNRLQTHLNSRWIQTMEDLFDIIFDYSIDHAKFVMLLGILELCHDSKICAAVLAPKEMKPESRWSSFGLYALGSLTWAGVRLGRFRADCLLGWKAWASGQPDGKRLWVDSSDRESVCTHFFETICACIIKSIHFYCFIEICIFVKQIVVV